MVNIIIILILIIIAIVIRLRLRKMSWRINIIEDVQLSIISLIRIMEDDQNYRYYQHVSGARTL